MTFESPIDAQGRTTLPSAVRVALDVRAGDRVLYLVEGREVRIRPLRSIARLRGIVPPGDPPLSLEGIDRVIAEGACDG